jgi:tRNA threonylcarbamoyladenosine biosynthesis protein TsaB
MILALDTSTDDAGIALVDGPRCRLEWTWSARANHSVQVNALLKSALHVLDASPRDLRAIAVATGPGSFNGVRVGISLAKGLGMALEIPVAGIATLDAIGLQASELSASVLAVIGAGRGEVFTALYEGTGPGWLRRGECVRVSLAEARDLWQLGMAVAGPAADELGVPEEAVVRAPWRLQRPGFLAELGRRYFDGGGQDQLHRLEPLYLRLSAAEEQRAARLGG